MSLLIQEGNLLCIIGISGVPQDIYDSSDTAYIFLSGKCKGPLQALLAALDHFAFTVLFASWKYSNVIANELYYREQSLSYVTTYSLVFFHFALSPAVKKITSIHFFFFSHKYVLNEFLCTKLRYTEYTCTRTSHRGASIN